MPSGDAGHFAFVGWSNCHYHPGQEAKTATTIVLPDNSDVAKPERCQQHPLSISFVGKFAVILQPNLGRASGEPQHQGTLTGGVVCPVLGGRFHNQIDQTGDLIPCRTSCANRARMFSNSVPS